MKLDYDTLISPYPLILQKIGSIKSPTLKEIWDPSVTYQNYNMYLIFLLLNTQTYCENVNTDMKEWYQSLQDKEKCELSMFDFIINDKSLQNQYQSILEFFFVENILWDDSNKVFFTYVDKDEDGDIIPVGIIHRGIWSELCDVILQRCDVNRNDKIEKVKFKSKVAQEVWELTHSKEKEEKEDKNLETGNIISSVAAKDESLNMLNIWDLTIYQLYDQFRKIYRNNYFYIQSMNVAAWGDEKNKFDITGWYKNIQDN